MKFRLLLVIILLGAIFEAQAESVKSRLQEVYRLIYNEDEAGARAALNLIPEEIISAQNDTIQYDYYYCKAALLEIPAQYGDAYNQALSLQQSYLEKALNLRETKLGIHHFTYIEILSQLASYYSLIEQDLDKAIVTYEKALVMGMYLKAQNDEATNYWYGNIFWQLASLYEIKGYDKQLISLYKSVSDILPEDSDIPPYIGYALLAAYYDRKGQYNEAIEANTNALNIIERTEGRGVNYVQTLNSIGNNQIKAGKNQEAINTILSAMEIAHSDTTSVVEIPNLSATLLLGYIRVGNRAKESETFQQIAEYAKSGQSTNYVDVMYSAAKEHIALREFSIAREYNNNILNLAKVILKGTLAIALHQRCEIEAEIGKPSDVLFYAEWAFETASDDKCNISMDNKLSIDLYLADIYNEEKQYGKCITVLNSAIDLYQSSPEYADIFNYIVGYIANCYLNLGDFESARNVYKYYKNTLLDDSNPHLVADTNNKLAVVELLDNKPLEAIRLLDLSWNYFRDTVGENSDEYCLYLHNKGRAYMLQGKTKEAKKYLLKSKEVQLAVNGQVMDRTAQYLEELNLK
jgi:tetratricopeptide (TPR) repeat protein